ncbi:MAG: hypothetical protein Q9181_003718 [Wetmoreana brouardii]
MPTFMIGAKAGTAKFSDFQSFSTAANMRILRTLTAYRPVEMVKVSSASLPSITARGQAAGVNRTFNNMQIICNPLSKPQVQEGRRLSLTRTVSLLTAATRMLRMFIAEKRARNRHGGVLSAAGYVRQLLK